MALMEMTFLSWQAFILELINGSCNAGPEHDAGVTNTNTDVIAHGYSTDKFRGGSTVQLCSLTVHTQLFLWCPDGDPEFRPAGQNHIITSETFIPHLPLHQLKPKTVSDPRVPNDAGVFLLVFQEQQSQNAKQFWLPGVAGGANQRENLFLPLCNFFVSRIDPQCHGLLSITIGLKINSSAGDPEDFTVWRIR